MRLRLCYLLLFIPLFCSGLYAQRERPNIIFILTDDQRFDALGHYGNDLALTPEMDQLAAGGAYFPQALVTTPICAASRATLLSGVYERTHRFNFQTGNMRDEYMDHAYPRLLRENGYRTAFYGKYGIRYNGEDKLFDEYETYDRNNAYKDRRGYYYKTIDGDTVHLTRYTGQKGLDFVAKQKGDKPFMLALNFSAPHAHDRAEDQYFWQRPQDAHLAGKTVPAPALGAQKYFDALPAPVREGFNRTRWHWRYDTPEKYQHSVKGYFRMIAGIDKEIGKLRTELERRGLADNTVIILMGDNGYFLGERQLAGKWLMYDRSVRVPLIIYDPRARTQVRSEVQALNVDVPATIAALAGIEQPTTWQGTSLLPVVNGNATIPARDTVLIEHIWEFENIPPSEGVRTKNWKYFRYVNDQSSEELYHLGDDPQETENLVDNPDHAQTLATLRRKCDRLIASYTDAYGSAPTGLHVEYLREPTPVALVDATPEFGWQVPTGSVTQNAYQILVASSREQIDANLGDVWDSGRVAGDASLDVVYAGPALRKSTPYFWKVRIWDERNRLTDYSAPQTFRYGGPVADEMITTGNSFRVERIAPVGVKPTGEGSYFVDFGKAAFGNVELTYTARRKHELTVRIGEKLVEDGTIDQEPPGHVRTWTVTIPVEKGTRTYQLPLVPDERNTLPGKAVQLPDSFPVIAPFRYAEIAGAKTKVSTEDLRQIAYFTYWDNDRSYFTSSDDILNQVWEMCKYSMKATSFAGLYVDGDRERIPYEADAYLNQLSHYTTDPEYAIARRTIEYFMDYPTWPTEWQQHVALMFHADYMYTGNTELIEEYYEPLKYKTLLELLGENGLVSSTRIDWDIMTNLGFPRDYPKMLTDIVDWPSANWQGDPNVTGERDGFVFCDDNTVINALFFRNMEIMAEFADVLGKTEDKAEFEFLAARTKKIVNERFLDEEKGIYVDGNCTDHSSIHANMFPLAFGMVPEAHQQSVVDYIKSRGLACSVYGSQYLMDALYQAGAAQYGLDLMRSTDKRSWYNMIREGSTVSMEAWGQQYKPNQDWNHAWGAVPANAIPRRMWGIRPLTPGFGLAKIQPQLADLQHSKIRVPTLRGDIQAEYKRVNPRLRSYVIEVPGNMAASFSVAVEPGWELTHNGEKVNLAFGDVRLGPGQHRIDLRFNSF